MADLDRFAKPETDKPRLRREDRIVWPDTEEGRLQKIIAQCATQLASITPQHPAWQGLTAEENRAVQALAKHYRERPPKPLGLG